MGLCGNLARGAHSKKRRTRAKNISVNLFTHLNRCCSSARSSMEWWLSIGLPGSARPTTLTYNRSRWKLLEIISNLPLETPDVNGSLVNRCESRSEMFVHRSDRPFTKLPRSNKRAKYFPPFCQVEEDRSYKSFNTKDCFADNSSALATK